MTKICDLLGERADELVKSSLRIGDVHMLPLGKEEGITPKNGALKRNKFFIVLGFDATGNIIGGVVINSKINTNLPSSVTDYLMPVTVQQMSFLKYNSFVNCSQLKTVAKEKFNHSTYVDHIDDEELIDSIRKTVVESPYSNRQLLKEFRIIDN